MTLAEIVAPAVRLDVGLVVNVKADLVAEFVELPVLRIVAETYRIDIVGLHQLQVLAAELSRDIMTGSLVMLVDIDALELDRLAVHEEKIAPELEPAESDIERNHFGDLSVAAQGDEEAVEVRSLGRPFQHIGYSGIEADFSTGVRPCGTVSRTAAYHIACRIDELIAEIEVCACIGIILYQCLKTEDAVSVILIQTGDHGEVLNLELRLGPEEDIALDTADPPEILAFEIGTRTPAVNLYYQFVIPFHKIFVEEEFGRVLGILVVADFIAVDIYIHTGLGAGEVEVDIPPLPGFRHPECPAVSPVRNDVRQ